MPENEKNLSITGDDSVPVPVFNCRVFIRNVEGRCHARVANLAGIETSAANERAALSTIVSEFKNRVAQQRQSGEAIPWLSPELEMAQDEVERLIPIHL